MTTTTARATMSRRDPAGRAALPMLGMTLGMALVVTVLWASPARAQVRTVYEGCTDEPHCLDILFLPDDYGADFLSTFANDVYNYTTWLLGLEPFVSHLDRINVRRLDTTVDFQCHYGCHGSPSAICCDDGTVFAVAVQAPFDEVIVVVASNTYGGGATVTPGGSGRFSYSVVYRNVYSLGRPLLSQLFGTSFGGLMSEAVTGGTGSPFGPNCSPAGCAAWSDVPGTSCVAGCSYTNLFRATNDACLMHGLTPVGGQQFCPVCRRALRSALDCVGVACQGPAPDACHAATGVCDNTTGGACVYPALPDGTPCSDGNACTQGDACVAGSCQAGGATTCPAPDACHQPGVCTPGTGACAYAARPNGTTCDDGNACTRASACVGGVCVGSDPVPCPQPASACLQLTGCAPATGECRYTPKPDLTPCDDFDACTTGDVCLGAWCSGLGALACPAPDDCHYDGYCDQVLQDCTFLERPDGTACDDHDACTQADACKKGNCVGSEPVACAPAGPCQVAAICDHGSGLCLYTSAPEGTACTDGNACTPLDECRGGACRGLGSTTCPAPPSCREPGVCDPATGACAFQLSANGAACNDGNGCTPIDTCQGGACAGSGSVACTASGPCRKAGTCDPLSGQCSSPPVPNGTPCDDDGNPCSADACFGGGCQHFPKPAGTPCPDDGLACTTDRCEAGVCAHPVGAGCVLDGACHDFGDTRPGEACRVCSPANPYQWTPASPGLPCDDGDAATDDDRCVGGRCVGDAKACIPQAACLDVGVADPVSGTCDYPALPDGTPCDDLDPCTRFDACAGGVCVGGSPRPCLGPGPCWQSLGCDGLTGECRYAQRPDGTGCDDGDACTLGDACVDGACLPGAPATCAPSGPCRVAGACDPNTGACLELPRPDGAWCDDGSACTRLDVCVGGECVGSQPVMCPAPATCRAAGSCDPTTGACTATALADGTPCDDGNPCTLGDACGDGACLAGAPVQCAPLDSCHAAGQCDPLQGTCSNPARDDGAPCDDGDPCTAGDACSAGACRAGVPVTCPAPDACRGTGACDATSGTCVYPSRPDGTPCSDGDACTLGDACAEGICRAAITLQCPADTSCRVGAGCDPVTGACVATLLNDGTACDDGDACTAGDRCIAGACAPAEVVACPQPGPCEKAVICDPSSGACVVTLRPDGDVCDDGDACTPKDTCLAGACVPGTPKTCPAAPACHESLGCDPASGACATAPVADLATCDDGDACTGHDACIAGQCQGRDPIVCPPASPCQQGAGCDPWSGLCGVDAVPNGLVCDDLDPCTLADSCQDGACRGALFKVCPAIDACHLPGDCNPLSGECSEPAKDDGAPCAADDDPCSDGACQHGVCLVTTLPDGTLCPDDGLSCSSDYCLHGACSHPVEGGCLIDGACVLLGTANPENACASCQTGHAFDWSPLPDDALCLHADPCLHGGHCVTGLCTGATANPAGSPCGDTTRCLAGTLYTQGQCSAVGNCVAGPVESCAPYAFCATGTKCGTSCEKDGDCTDGYRCLAWECQINTAPVADAGSDQVVDEEAQVTLDGRLSSDADGDSLGFVWTQAGGPTVTLQAKTSATPGFVAPKVTTATTLVFRLVVDDGAEPSAPDETLVTVQNSTNEKPKADTGADLVVDEGALVTLDGAASTDPNGDALTFAWSQQAGPAVDVSDLAATAPTFAAPYVEKNTALLFMLIVNDGQANSVPDDVWVTVRETGATPPEPVAEGSEVGDAGGSDAADLPTDTSGYAIDVGGIHGSGSGSSCAVAPRGAPLTALLLAAALLLFRRRRT